MSSRQIKVVAKIAVLVFLFLTLSAFADDPSGSGSFIEYEYDESGRIIGIITVVDESPPEISHIDPAIVRRGPAVAATIHGSGLRQAQIETDHPGLSVSSVTSSASWVSLELTADASVPLGLRTLTLTTTLGSDTVNIEVYPRLPELQVSPDPVAISPAGQVALDIGIDSADVIDHVFELSVVDPSVAEVSHGAVVIEAEQLEPQTAVTLDGAALGTTRLRLESDEIVDRSVPVYVTEPWQPPPGGVEFFSPAVGVSLGEPPSPPRLIEYGPFVSMLGVVMPGTPDVTPGSRGPLVAPLVGINVGSVLESLSPSNVVRGGDAVSVTATGVGLDQVASAELVPPQDVVVSVLSAATDGTSLSLEVQAAAQAELGSRRLRLLTGSGESLPPADAASDRLRITDPVPVVESVSPLHLVRGEQNVELIVRGRLLGEVETVQLVPADGVTVGSTPEIAADGRSLRIDLAVAGDAPLGPRTVVVTSPAGSSEITSSAYNTVEVVDELVGRVTPVVAPLLGIVLDGGGIGPGSSVTSRSPEVGVTLGAVMDGILPAAGGAGTNLTLTVSGSGLQAATNLRFEPDTGIAISGWSSIPDGSALSVDVAIAADAPRTLRRVVVETAEGVVPPSGADDDRFRVTEQMPQIDSVAPVLLAVDSGPTSLRISGSNLHEAASVELLPPDDVEVGVPQSAADGTWVDVDVTVSAAAEVGSRALVVHTPAGATAGSPTSGNTVNLVTGVDTTVTPLVSPLVGVDVASTPPSIDSEVSLIAPLLGVEMAETIDPESPIRAVRSSLLGATVGSVVTALQPQYLPVDADHEILVEGVGLDNVGTVAFDPPDGIVTIAGPDAAADGSSVSLTVTIEPDAAQTTRRISVIENDQSIAVARPADARVQVVGTEPAITSVSPIQAIPDETISLVVRGYNLFGVTAVSAEPSSGLTFGVNPQGNAAGTQVTVNVTIDAAAPPGPRAIRVHAAGGVTPGQPTSANTLNILGD